MRERSPAKNLSVEKCFESLPIHIKRFVTNLRYQKSKGARPKPSTSLIDKSKVLSAEKRSRLLDKIVELVDENLFGRSEMSTQFADLLQKALNYLQIPAEIVLGNVTYYQNEEEIFSWGHAWVEIDQEIIDGNIDSIIENPACSDLKDLGLKPYWGPIPEIPEDRDFEEDPSLPFFDNDYDVKVIWWPELKIWLDENLNKLAGEICSIASLRSD